jgi:hypothetical protein
MGGRVGVVAFSVGGRPLGDPYYTDGELEISVLVKACNQRSEKAAKLANPPLVDPKSRA